jgi:hypothetical protein
MNPFCSISEMVQTHETMWGEAGGSCAQAVLRYATLFDEPLNPLCIRVALAPIELGPYNRHYGYTNVVPREEVDVFRLILGNRHICKFASDGSIELRDRESAEDFIVHELTHHRQDVLLARQSRGVHRDAGWYGAISEAASRYLGVAFPESVWPKQKSVRAKGTVRKVNEPGRLTEVEASLAAFFPQTDCGWGPEARPLQSKH